MLLCCTYWDVDAMHAEACLPPALVDITAMTSIDDGAQRLEPLNEESDSLAPKCPE